MHALTQEQQPNPCHWRRLATKAPAQQAGPAAPKPVSDSRSNTTTPSHHSLLFQFTLQTARDVSATSGSASLIGCRLFAFSVGVALLRFCLSSGDTHLLFPFLLGFFVGVALSMLAALFLTAKLCFDGLLCYVAQLLVIEVVDLSCRSGRVRRACRLRGHARL